MGKQSQRRKGLLRELVTNRTLYLMCVPAILLFFLINYLPLFGLVLPFKDFSFSLGIVRSPWADPLFRNFEFFFRSGVVWRITRNTFLYNLAFIVIGNVVAVTLAVMLNEVRSKTFVKFTQASFLLPYFMSWIVGGMLLQALLAYDFGVVNGLLQRFGLDRIDWYGTPEAWPGILVMADSWREGGYRTVLYLAALAGISPELYEAAEVDGASRWKQIKTITIPLLMPTVTILALLEVGRIMNADFGKFYALVGENSRLYPTADVIDTYVFRTLRSLGNVGMAAAPATIQSVIGFLLVILVNSYTRRKFPEGSLF
ncbi:MAG: sugar ABC transporter permease [Spirochaetaceae bacterium]|nr:MAG: sugar ABC transporter permease [Spirochaetaceae bacterium]